MNNGDITILSILAVMASAVTYIVNKWVIPAYKAMKEELVALQKLEKKLLERIQELEINLAIMRERYADSALHSRGSKNKKKDE